MGLPPPLTSESTERPLKRKRDDDDDDDDDNNDDDDDDNDDARDMGDNNDNGNDNGNDNSDAAPADGKHKQEPAEEVVDLGLVSDPEDFLSSDESDSDME